MTRIYGRERLVFSRQQMCDDLLNSLPKLHAALRSNPSKNEQLWRRTSRDNARVSTFELVGMPPNDGGADGTEVNYAVAASTKLKCHLNEVLNVLVSQKTSDYGATMQALSGKRFERGEVLYRERCRLVPNGEKRTGTQALLGVQMAALRPSWQLRLTPSHLCHPEHPSSQRLCFASLTHRYPEADRAVHVMKTLPKRVHDQIIPREYRSALRREVDHLGAAFDIASRVVEGRQWTRIFVHAYVASPSLENSGFSDHRNGRPRSRTSPELWEDRGPCIVKSEAKHVVNLLTQQLTEFERVIRRRRLGFQSFIYFQPSTRLQSDASNYPLLSTICHICVKRFSLFRREFYCQICGHVACGECSQLCEVEARIGQVRENRLCLNCIARVDACTFADEDIVAALGPTVVSLRGNTQWSQAFGLDDDSDTVLQSSSVDSVSCSKDPNERCGLLQLSQVLFNSKPVNARSGGDLRQSVTRDSVQTQLERYLNYKLRDVEHKYPSTSLKTADLVRDYRYTFDATQTTYEGHPLPPTPSSAREARRLHHIQASGVLEPEYDHSALDLLAQVAAERLHCPIGFVSVVDEASFYSVGTYPPHTFDQQASRTESLCAHTVYVDKPLVIKNAHSDLRFAQLAVVRDHGIRFYAGFPIRASDGSIVASLCTVDRAPHLNMSTADYAIMQTLACLASRLVAPRNRVPSQPRVRSNSNCRMKHTTRSRSQSQRKREPTVTTMQLETIHSGQYCA
ncbi:hypothetical protein PInf_008564 [Phytophthora infestans]|nr:hypothetical protein PInf_008564 [Phytophthora infestans]